MASKQLEIIVAARDQASGVLQNVAASTGVLTGAMANLNEVAEAGHGMHMMLRQARNVFIAMEVLPVATKAVEAVWKSLTGTAEEAAVGQRELLDAIKEFPIVGHAAAAAAEWLGEKIAHAFGKQSLAEEDADMAQRKKVLGEFAAESKKLAADLETVQEADKMAGLTPSEADIERAKEIFAKRMQELHAAKRAIIQAAGQGVNVSQQTNEVKELEDAAADARDKAIAKAHARQLAEDQKFGDQIDQVQSQRGHEMAALAANMQEEQLEAEGRGYEARALRLTQSLDEKLAQIKAGGDKAAQALREATDKLGSTRDDPVAAAMDVKARQALDSLPAQQKALEDQARADEKAQAAAAAKNELDRASTELLQAQAAAGDVAAKKELERLNNAKQYKEIQSAMTAILNDAGSSGDDRARAKKELSQLADLEHQRQLFSLEQNRLELLKRQADLGDVNAAAELRQMQIAKQYADERARLLAMDQSAERDGQLAALNRMQAEQGQADLKSAGLKILQTEAQLGNQQAAKQLKKLEVEQRYNEQRAQLLAIEKNGSASQAAQAKELLAASDRVEALEMAGDKKGSTAPEKSSGLATMLASQFLTGVAARAGQERSPMQPVVDATKEQTGVMNKIASLLESVLTGKSTAPAAIPVR